jgi:hypothetical protein
LLLGDTDDGAPRCLACRDRARDGRWVVEFAWALAQATTPSLPGAPQATPAYPGGSRTPLGAQGGSGNYSVSAAANEHAAFLWVVDNIQHSVVLCEKTDSHDFACTKKPLP